MGCYQWCARFLARYVPIPHMVSVHLSADHTFRFVCWQVQRTDMVLSPMSRCSRIYQMQQKEHLFYTSDQASRNSYMTDEIPCNSGKSLLLQGILLLVHTEMRSENRPQVTVLRSVRSSAFRASMSRGEQHDLVICWSNCLTMLPKKVVFHS